MRDADAREHAYSCSGPGRGRFCPIIAGRIIALANIGCTPMGGLIMGKRPAIGIPGITRKRRNGFGTGSIAAQMVGRKDIEKRKCNNA